MPDNPEDKKEQQTPPTEPKARQIIIQGVTPSGEAFRPSNWAERMSGNLSTFRKHRLYYSPLLHPSIKDGYKCVILDKRLKESNPKLYKSILSFAHKNKLSICGEDETDPSEAKAEKQPNTLEKEKKDDKEADQ